MGQVVLSELPDEELVRLCQLRGSRDERPFQELFRRHRTLVWRICYGFTHNPQDAEDLTQDVFFKVYRSLAGFEGRSSLKTWLYQIATNTARNELRRRSRRPQEAGTAVEEMAEFLPDQTNVETIWQRQAQRELLALALSQLKAKEEEILLLKDVEQLPYQEIADTINISLSAAKMRVQRARFALQAIYHELEERGHDT